MFTPYRTGKNFWHLDFAFSIFLSFPQVFDMKKFQQNLSRELKRPYPDRRKLESQCLSAVAFAAGEDEDGEIFYRFFNF